MATTTTSSAGVKPILAPGTPASYSKKKPSKRKSTKKPNKKKRKSVKLVKGKTTKSRVPNLNQNGRKKAVLGGIDKTKGKITFN